MIISIRTKWAKIIVVGLLFTSCNDLKQSSDNSNIKVNSTQKGNKPIESNNQNTLDWVGVYEGIVPCGDCEGIKTTITLNSNNTFFRVEEYLGVQGTPSQDKGTIEWDKVKNIVTLKDKDRNQKYKVDDNQLLHLDMSANIITGSLADMYILHKKPDSFN